jgi:hypothetical protein
MTLHRLLVACVATTVGLSGCGGGSSPTSLSTGTSPPPQSVSIAFQPPPPGSLTINLTTPVTAVVSNDPTNAGVNWVLTCHVTDCGSLSSVHTASGAATTYSPPSQLSGGNSQIVNLVAFAASDDTKNVLAPITVMGFADKLKGTYVFETAGTDIATFLPSSVAGVLVADGNGNITGGQQTYGNSQQSVSDPITGGSYIVGVDGRGTITINTADPNVGNQGVETFSVVILSASQALIAELDATQSSTGTMDLQTSVAPPLGGYAFVVSGLSNALDPVSSLPDPLAFGGVFNVDSPGVISGTGSVADEDVGCSGNGCVLNSATLSGTVSPPSPLGAVTINLTASFTALPVQLTGYIVDATQIKLIESDNGSGTGFGATSGVAIAQGAATATFSGNRAFSGSFVYGIPGQLTSLPYRGTFGLAGLFTADGAGHLINGFTDETTAFGSPIGDTLVGTYKVDGSGTGRVTATTTFGSSGAGPTLIFYLTGNGEAPLVLNSDVLTLGAGRVYTQSSGLTLNGPYGLDFSQFDPNLFAYTDGTAQITAQATTGTLAGTADLNVGFTPSPQIALTGTFNSPSSSRFTGTLTQQSVSNAVAFYGVDSAHGLFIQIDGLQVALGYFASRELICPTCFGPMHSQHSYKLAGHFDQHPYPILLGHRRGK